MADQIPQLVRRASDIRNPTASALHEIRTPSLGFVALLTYESVVSFGVGFGRRRRASGFPVAIGAAESDPNVYQCECIS